MNLSIYIKKSTNESFNAVDSKIFFLTNEIYFCINTHKQSLLLTKIKIMKEVIINGIFAAKDYIVTLIYNEDRNVVCYSVARRDIPSYIFYQELHIDVSEDQEKEIMAHAEKIWGYNQGMYILNSFIPLSADLWQFIEDCWDAIKRQEPKLFPKQ